MRVNIGTSFYRCFHPTGYISNQKIGTPHSYFGYRYNPRRRYVQVRNCGNNRTEILQPRKDISVRYGYAVEGDEGYNDFEWGNLDPNGASQQLAVVLLDDATGNALLAEAAYEQFEREVIAHLPNDSWVLSDIEVIDWVIAHHGEIAKNVRHIARLRTRRLTEELSYLKAETEAALSCEFGGTNTVTP